MSADNAPYPLDLLRRLDASFSLDDILTLSLALGFDYENLPGDTREARIRALITRLIRQDRLPELVTLARAQRPAIAWPDPPPGLALFGDDPFADGAYRRQDFEPEIAYVPAGLFVMGDDGGPPAEAPSHQVDLPAFGIGVYPVTNAQYDRFIRDTRRAASPLLLWDGNRPPAGRLRHPVTGVTWHEARDYCRWLTQQTGRPYTLPTEAQWEKAARGPDGRRFPWGDEWLPDRANTGADTTPVDAYPAQSVYGVRDLVGNAREWTLSVWGSDPRVPDPLFAYPWRDDDRNDPDHPDTIRRIYRGGRVPPPSSAASSPPPGSPAPVPSSPGAYRCSARGGFVPDKGGPSGNRHGFRVALNFEQGRKS